MNCETFTRVSTASLYKNGRLITQASAIFLIRKCNEVNLNIDTRTFCCCRNRMLRVLFTITNTGENIINNTVLFANIIPKCCCNPCCKNVCRKFIVNNLLPNNIIRYYLDIPFPCNCHYFIKGSIIQNSGLLKEECITV